MALWLEYLNRHFPLDEADEPIMDLLSAKDCAEVAYEYFGAMETLLDEIDRPDEPAFSWSRVAEVDEALKQIAVEGTLDPLGRINLGGVFELRARLEWCVTALLMEDAAGSDWSQHMPHGCPEDTRTIAVLLALLDGDGRDYPQRPNA